jgi:hypothetical protein
MANPTPPAPAPLPTKAPFNLNTAATHVPAHIIKLLKSQLIPLAETTLPDP